MGVGDWPFARLLLLLLLTKKRREEKRNALSTDPTPTTQKQEEKPSAPTRNERTNERTKKDIRNMNNLLRKAWILAVALIALSSCVEASTRNMLQTDLAATLQEEALDTVSGNLRGYFCPYGSSSDFIDYLDENANVFGEEGSPLSVLLFTFVGIGAETLYRQNAESFGLRGC